MSTASKVGDAVFLVIGVISEIVRIARSKRDRRRVEDILGSSPTQEILDRVYRSEPPPR